MTRLSPYICAIYGLEKRDGICFLILELVGGETLAHKLADVSRLQSGGSGLPLRDAASPILDLPGADLATQNFGYAGAASLARVAAPDVRGFWIHLDVDILNPVVMPAVDSPEPGELTPDELTWRRWSATRGRWGWTCRSTIPPSTPTVRARGSSFTCSNRCWPIPRNPEAHPLARREAAPPGRAVDAAIRAVLE